MSVDALPESIDALVLASDLQGVVSSWRDGGANVLLGVALADELLTLAERGVLPAPDRVGVLLAGDLFSAPNGDVRGASGDVREVWRAFAVAHPWVAGVQGNHDQFGPDPERAFDDEPDVYLLDFATVTFDDLTIAGVGGVIGDPAKGGRRNEEDFLASIDTLWCEDVDVLVLHEGPDGQGEQRGNAHVRELLERVPSEGRLVVCGHVHWDAPLASLASGAQVLNADSRVLVLERA